jgi:hypothetical protein
MTFYNEFKFRAAHYGVNRDTRIDPSTFTQHLTEPAKHFADECGIERVHRLEFDTEEEYGYYGDVDTVPVMKFVVTCKCGRYYDERFVVRADANDVMLSLKEDNPEVTAAAEAALVAGY